MSDQVHFKPTARREAFYGGAPHLDVKFKKSMMNEKNMKEMVAYDWEDDKNYQVGLAAILGPNQDADQVESLTRRAQVFYWNKVKNLSIDFNEYEAFVKNPSANESAIVDDAESPQPAADAPYPRSFAETVTLIQSGADVPGIRQIESTVLKNGGTTAGATRRLKPWEEAALKDSDDDEDGGVKLEEGTFGDHRDMTIQQEYPDEEENVEA